jgi:N-acetylmuramoyl-L-alanine amidase
VAHRKCLSLVFLTIFCFLIFFSNQSFSNDDFITIIIDPMYGGSETGPVGINNIQGKDVTLDCALRLERIFKVNNFNVFLTRNMDSDMSLEKRVNFANFKKGNFYISIGVNSTNDNKVSGVETYILDISPERINIKDIEKFSEAEANIAKKLMSDERLKLKEAKKLAYFINNKISEKLEIKNRGIKSAPFYILIGPNMPAVAVFVDFISNPRSEENLGKPEFREKIAQLIFEAFSEYRNQK